MAQEIGIEPRPQRSGDALAAAFELVATPALFAFFGWRIDIWLGTAPVFLLVLTLITAAYSVWRLYSQYSAEMDSHDTARRAARLAAAEQDGSL